MKPLLFSLLFLCLCVGCSQPDSPAFYRITATQKANNSPNTTLKLNQGFNNRWYFFENQTTIPYYGYDRSIVFKSPRSGYTGLYFSLYTNQRDKLIVQQKTSTGELTHTYRMKKGINEIGINSTFLKGDRITATLVSGLPAVASNPVFFKTLPPQKRELIFLISVDTLAASHMSLYGYKKKTTANLQAFARDAVVFDNAFANSSWTVSSHMSLFTGLLEYGHRVYVQKQYITEDQNPFKLKQVIPFPLASTIPTLAEILSKQYLTFSFNGGANVSAHFAFNRGFDLYLSHYKDMTDPNASATLFERVQSHLLTFPLPKAFYFLHTYQVHSPYHPQPKEIPGEKTLAKRQSFDFDKDLGGLRHIYKPLPREEVEDVVALYDSEITAFDMALNAFLTFLKSQQLYDQATIILVSDHGEEFLEPSSWVHASNVSTRQIWVPLLIKFPGQMHGGKRVKTPVSLVDVMPSLLEYKKIKCPDHLYGVSFVDEFTHPTKERPPVVSMLFRCKPEIYFPGKIALIQQEFKLIYNEAYIPGATAFFKDPLPALETFQLFNLNSDPFEKTNIFLSQKGSKRVKGLVKKMTEILRVMNQAFQNQPQQGAPLSEGLKRQLQSLGYF